MKLIAFSIFLLLFLQLAKADISSSAATDKVGPYLLQNENNILLIEKQVTLRSDRSYWIFFFPPTSKERLIVGVDNNNGEVVGDEGTLNSLAAVAYQYFMVSEDPYQGYLQSNGVSNSFLTPIFSNSNDVLQTRITDLSTFASEIHDKYPQIKLDEVEARQGKLSSLSEGMLSTLQFGQSLRDNFKADYSSQSLDNFFSYYNTTFTKLNSFFTAYDDYLRAISYVEATLPKSGIPDPDNKNIFQSLESLRDIGISSIYPKVKLFDPLAKLEEKTVEGGAWSNDSVSSFLFRKAKVDATNSYNAYTPKVQWALTNKNDLETRCGIYLPGLEAEWNAIASILSQATKTEDFSRALTKINVVGGRLDQANSNYDKCVQTPASSHKATQNNNVDYTSIIAALAIIGIGFYAYNTYFKKREEEVE